MWLQLGQLVNNKLASRTVVLHGICLLKMGVTNHIKIIIVCCLGTKSMP